MRKRLEEKREIEEANLVYLQRVEDSKPIYDKRAWEEERCQNLTYLANISRFPEGYAEVLEKQGVPLPGTAVHSPLPIRTNRSYQLKVEHREQKRGLASAGIRGRGSPEQRGGFQEELGGGEDGTADASILPKRRLKIHMTNSARLKREYAQAVLAGEEAVDKFIAAHSEGPVRATSVAPSVGDESGDESRPASPTKQKIRVRLNRAQKLRLEEQEQARVQAAAAQQRFATDLSHVEARIDFGRPHTEQPEAPPVDPAEVEREALLSATSVDDSDFVSSIEVESLPSLSDDKLRLAVILGAPVSWLWKDLPSSYSVDARAYWLAASEDDAHYERETIVDNVVPGLREYARSIGLEFSLKDVEWGWTKKMEDDNLIWRLQLAEIEKCSKESVGIKIIVFLGDKRGPPQPLPSTISVQIFDNLLKIVEAQESKTVAAFDSEERDISSDEISPSQMLRKLYRIEENNVPPVYCLRTMSETIKSMGSINLAGWAAAHKYWRSHMYEPSRLALCQAAQFLMYETDEGPGDSVVEQLEGAFGQSAIEYKLFSIIDKPTADAILLQRKLLDFHPVSADGPEGPHIDWTPDGRQVDAKAGADLANIQARLISGLPSEHVIEGEIHWQPGTGIRPTLYPSHQAYLMQLQDALTNCLSTALEMAADKLPRFDPLFEEIIHHAQLFKNKTATQFIGRTKHVDKLIRFFGLRCRQPIPPFVVVGPSGTGKSSMVCHALKAQSVAVAKEVPAFLSEMTSCPVVILRWIGTTPESSTAAGLMASMCKQIKMAYLHTGLERPEATDYLRGVPTSYSRLCSEFWGLLRLASHRRPLTIVLLGVDKLTEGEGRRLGWLPLENMPTSVQVVLTVSTEEGTNWEFLEPRMKSTTRLLQEAALDTFEENVTTTGDFDLLSCHIALSKWLNADGRALSRDQFRGILERATAGYTRANPLAFRSMYSHARQWTCQERPSDHEKEICNSMEQALDSVFSRLEETHGRALVARSCRLLCILRDGISESEFEDLLSIDRKTIVEVVSEESPFATGAHAVNSQPVVSRVPPIVISALLSTLIDEFGFVARFSQGASRGVPLLRWAHQCCRTAACVRYLDDHLEEHRAILSEAASYFWYDDAADESQAAIGSREKSKEIALLPDERKVEIRSHKKRIPPQYTDLAAGRMDLPIHNSRKIRELPRLLVSTQRWNLLHVSFSNFMFLEGLLAVQECNNVIADTSFSSFIPPFVEYFRENRKDLERMRGGRLEYADAWKPETEDTEAVPFFHEQVQCCASSSDGKMIATGSRDGSIRVWDAITGEEIHSFHHIVSLDRVAVARGATGEVSSLAFSHDRAQLVSAAGAFDAAPTLRIWSLKAGSATRTLSGAHKVGGKICFVSFLPPEERRILSVSSDGSAVTWELARGKMIRSFVFEKSSTDGRSTRDNPWTSGPIGTETQRGCTFAGAVSDSGYIAYGSSTLTVLDPKWKEIATFDLSAIPGQVAVRSHRLTSVIFSPDSESLFASACVDPIEVERVLSELATEWKSEPETSDQKKIAPSSTCIRATVGAAKQIQDQVRRVRQSVIRAWNIPSGQMRFSFSLDDQISSLSITQDGRVLFTGGDRGVLTGRLATTGELFLIREGHARGIVQIASVPTKVGEKGRKQGAEAGNITLGAAGQYQLFSASGDGSGLLWNLEGNPRSGQKPVVLCNFSPSGQLLLTMGGGSSILSDGGGSRSGSLVQLWDVETGLCRCRFDASSSGRPEPIFASFLGADPNLILLGYSTGLVAVHKVPAMSSEEPQIVHEFIVEAETVWGGDSEGDVWPFAATGTRVASFALHPTREALAVAFIGKERVRLAENEWIASESRRSSLLEKSSMDRRLSVTGSSMDRRLSVASTAHNRLSTVSGSSSAGKLPRNPDDPLRDLVKIAFWDFAGNPYTAEVKSDLSIMIDPIKNRHNDLSPGFYLPPTAGLPPFVMNWARDGTSLLLSDEDEIIREVPLEFRSLSTTQRPSSAQVPKFSVSDASTYTIQSHWRPTMGKYQGLPSLPSPATCLCVRTVRPRRPILPKTPSFTQEVPALEPILAPTSIHTTFAYGDGIIVHHAENLRTKTEAVQFMLAQRGPECGRIVFCDFVPGCGVPLNASKFGKRNDGIETGGIVGGKSGVSGVIVSVGRDGTIMVQEPDAQILCAVVHVGRPLRTAAVCPLSQSDIQEGGFRLAVGGGNGEISIFRYRP
ncbi:hypothetical protein HK104_001331 [Borealophlyctis nickersoniae]|nr:hypothetical protein HK104_001331 [Borealophlyctis nickersoniae]